MNPVRTSLAGLALLAVLMAPKVRIMTQFAGLPAEPSAAEPTSSPSLAAGPWQLLQAGPAGLRHTDRRGGNPQQQTAEELFDDAVAGVAATALFDRLSGRVFVTAYSTGSDAALYLGVNATNELRRLPAGDPLTEASWCRFRVDLGDGQAGPVGVHLGSNDRWLVAVITPERPEGSPRIAVFDKAKLLDYASVGQCPEKRPVVFDLEPGHRVRAAVHDDPIDSRRPPLYLLDAHGGPNFAEYVLLRIEGGSRPRLRRTTFQMPEPYEPPPAAPQRGGAPLETGTGDVSSLTYRGGQLWATQAVACSDGDSSCVRVLRIKPAARGRRVETARFSVRGKRGASLWRPEIAVNRHGDVMIVAVMSAASQNVGTAVSIKDHDGAQFGPTKLVRKGNCPLAQRSLDHVAARALQPDPFDDTSFWAAATFAERSGADCRAATRVAHLERRGGTTAPSVVLGSGQLRIPVSQSPGDANFHHEVGFDVTVPGDLGATAGRHLVLRLRDLDHPGLRCGIEHPTSGCVTVDYSCPEMRLDNNLDVRLGGRTTRLNLSDSQLLVTDPVVRPG